MPHSLASLQTGHEVSRWAANVAHPTHVSFRKVDPADLDGEGQPNSFGKRRDIRATRSGGRRASKMLSRTVCRGSWMANHRGGCNEHSGPELEVHTQQCDRHTQDICKSSS